MRFVAAAGSPIWSAALIALFITGVALVSKGWRWLFLGAVLVTGGWVLDDAVGQLLGSLTALSGDVVPSSEISAAAAAVGGLSFGLARLQAWTAAIVVTAVLLFLLVSISIALMYLERVTLSAAATGFFLGSVWAAIAVASFDQLFLQEARGGS